MGQTTMLNQHSELEINLTDHVDPARLENRWRVVLTLKNRGQEKHVIVPLHDEDWELDVRDENGRAVRALASMSAPSGRPKIRSVWLGRRSSWSIPLDLEFVRTGSFQVMVKYPGSVIQEYLDTAENIPQDVCSDRIESNVVRVKVLT